MLKRYQKIYIVLLLMTVFVFCFAACGPNRNDEEGGEQPGTKVTYEITVDASGVSVDTGEISVCVYSLDGNQVGEKKLSKGKTQFELDADSYLATLSGLSEEISYSSVLLTKSAKKAKITLKKSNDDPSSEKNTFAFTVVLIADNINLQNLNVQICDDDLCRLVMFRDSNVAEVSVSTGKYEVKVDMFSDNGLDSLFHAYITVTSDKRFLIIVL